MKMAHFFSKTDLFGHSIQPIAGSYSRLSPFIFKSLLAVVLVADGAKLGDRHRLYVGFDQFLSVYDVMALLVHDPVSFGGV